MAKKMAIARLGRSVGLRGDMRFFDLSDFGEQFVPGATFESDRGKLTIERIDPKRGTVKFVGVDTPEAAKRLTNAYLYSDEESTRANMELGEDEYFWFDIIGSDVYEDGERLGRVREIERLPAADYLVIDADEALAKEGARRFLVPFRDPFIKSVDTAAKRIELAGARDIWEAS